MQRKPRGVAIVVVLLVMSVLAVVAAAVVMLGTGNLTLAGSNRNSERAYYAAEAGLAITLVRLQADNNHAGTTESVVGSDATYATTVYRTPAVPPNGVALPGPEYRYIHAVGMTPAGTRREVGMLVKITDSKFNYAAFAKDIVDLDGGSMVDWYDSVTGTVPAGGRANVGSNRTGANAIRLDNGSRVKGAGYTAPGAPPNAVSTKNGSVVEDGAISMLSTVNLAPVVLPPPRGPLTPPVDAIVVPGDPLTGLDQTITANTVLPPGIYKKVEVDADATVTLVDGGVYVFEELKVKNGTIHVPLGISAPISVYVEKSFKIENGSLVNDTAKPPLMNIYGAQDPSDPSKGAKVELKTKKGMASTTGYYTVYTPDGEVKLKGDYDGGTMTMYPSHLYGAVIARQVSITDGSILTYDMALKNSSGGSSNLEILSHDRY